jgi:uncharacterized membrane protein (UPF0127 family)
MRRLFLILLLVSCTKSMPSQTDRVATESASTSAHATPAVATGPRVIFPDGFVVSVETVADDASRAQGLMYRDHLLPGTGMLFFFPQEGEYPFWMKNTRIPLDMIWIDSNHRVAHVKFDVPPCQTVDCPSYAPNAKAKYVLEVAGGVAREHGIRAGDVLRFEQTDHVVAR